MSCCASRGNWGWATTSCSLDIPGSDMLSRDRNKSTISILVRREDTSPTTPVKPIPLPVPATPIKSINHCLSAAAQSNLSITPRNPPNTLAVIWCTSRKLPCGYLLCSCSTEKDDPETGSLWIRCMPNARRGKPDHYYLVENKRKVMNTVLPS